MNKQQKKIGEKLAKLFLPLKLRTDEIMAISKSHNILDVGCYAGVDTEHFSELSSLRGSVTGLDVLLYPLKIARNSKPQNNLQYIQGDVHKLPFRDNYFDSVHAERVFQHLENPIQSFREILRVTKENGIIVIADTDHSASSFDSSYPDQEWSLRKEFLVKAQNPYAGRNLYSMFQRFGLKNIGVEVFSLIITDAILLSVIDPFSSLLYSEETSKLSKKYKLLREDIKNRIKNGQFFFYFPIIMVYGRKG
jgi:ubiquinone/menaquinone biosynthesis C-methylase UbiE